MLLFIAASAIAATTPGIAPPTFIIPQRQPTPTVAPVCQQVGAHKVGKPGAPLAHPLGKEPPADALFAVLYTEGNCTKPIVVSRGLGMKPGK